MEKLTVFRCFQGVEKGCIENKWVNKQERTIIYISLDYCICIFKHHRDRMKEIIEMKIPEVAIVFYGKFKKDLQILQIILHIKGC